jgi:hypothetical protein
MKPTLNRVKWLWLLAPLLAFVASCNQTPPPSDARKGDPTSEVNKDFEANPPLASEVRIEVLDQPDAQGNNVIITATFDEANRRKIDGNFVALDLREDQKEKEQGVPLSLLRDDGDAGDDNAGDNIFTLALNEPNPGQIEKFVDRLESELANAAEQASKEKRDIIQFINRSQVPLDRKVAVIDRERTARGMVFILPRPVLAPAALPNPAFIDHSLMITDLNVVEDPIRTYNPCTNVGAANGAWTFGTLVRQLASPNPGAIASDAATITFILDWLDTWNFPQVVNGDPLPPRSTASILNDWQVLSAANGAPPGTFKLENFPIRLLAIVNRMDLRGSSGYGFSNAGEGRFVFCILDQFCNPRQMTIIFEYGINKTFCTDVRAFGQQWASLAGMSFTDPAFNPALQDITDQFTLSGTNPARPNQSSINQVRTNEIALAGPWELREFNLLPPLALVTVKQEPQLQYNTKTNTPDVVILANWVNANSPAILANNYVVPDIESGQPFLGGKAHTQFPPIGPPPNVHHWDGDPTVGSPARIVDDNTRHVFSLNTCSGCHGGETQTFFLHVAPAPFGTPAPLSQFLTGAPGPPGTPFMVVDAAARPFGSPTSRAFADLWRRALDLQNLISRPCLRVIRALDALTFQPLNFQD